MTNYKEYGHKSSTLLMREVSVDGVDYLVEKNGVAHEKKAGFPVVKNKTILSKIKKEAK